MKVKCLKEGLLCLKLGDYAVELIEKFNLKIGMCRVDMNQDTCDEIIRRLHV